MERIIIASMFWRVPPWSIFNLSAQTQYKHCVKGGFHKTISAYVDIELNRKGTQAGTFVLPYSEQSNTEMKTGGCAAIFSACRSREVGHALQK